MPSHDDPEEGLLAPLRELFNAVDATLQRMADDSGELTGPSAVLAVLRNHLRPALDQELNDARASSAATWHMAHLASDMIASVGLPTGRNTPFQPVRDANKHLKEALAEAQVNPGLGRTGKIEELEALVRQVTPQVVDQLRTTLESQRQETLGKLGELETVVQHAGPDAVAQVRTTLADQHGETLGKLGDLQAAVLQVPEAVVNPLQATLDGFAAAAATELGEVEGLIEGLPNKLSDALVKSLPEAVRAIIAAIRMPPPPPPDPVIYPAPFGSLQELADASADDYTASAAQRIGFLQGALDVIQLDGPIPIALIPPIDNLVVNVLDYDDPANPLTIVELNEMTALKNQISPFLQSPAVPGVK